jgi:hypothetical protein
MKEEKKSAVEPPRAPTLEERIAKFAFEIANDFDMLVSVKVTPRWSNPNPKDTN